MRGLALGDQRQQMVYILIPCSDAMMQGVASEALIHAKSQDKEETKAKQSVVKA